MPFVPKKFVPKKFTLLYKVQEPGVYKVQDSENFSEKAWL